MVRSAVLAAPLLLALTGPLSATELDGVDMPNSVDVSGVHLLLNGVAIRTYSVLAVHVYVAALYLEHYTGDADEILKSNRTKMLRFFFKRHIDADDARASWREALDSNCRTPCHLPDEAVARFMAEMPTVDNGDTSTLLFTPQGLSFFVNGRLVGRLTDLNAVRVVLATFIGAYPSSEAVKRGLLGPPP
ncbi:MAG TPA: chalcone isomerase family protein [Rhodopila sp.]|jgi:hypothetical protein